MKRKFNLALILSILISIFTTPALAAPPANQGGGVHFGPYTLARGDSVSGDLTVFGPVTLKEDSTLDGDLVVFGPITIEAGATLEGDLVVMGATTIAGTVEGDIFSAGAVELKESAYIEGDVAAVGVVNQREGATVEGDLVPMEGEDFDDWDWDFPIDVPAAPVVPPMGRTRHPVWTGLRNLMRTLANILVMGLLALIISSIWPQQANRVGRTLEEAPLTAFGMGLLVFLGAGIILGILAITICLSPFALLGAVVIGVGVLLGWVALGTLLGQRILTGLLHKPNPTALASAVLGTVTLSFVMSLARALGPLHGLLTFILIPAAAGAVLLTRFGTMPYATQGRPSAPRAPAPAGAPVPPTLAPSLRAPTPPTEERQDEEDEDVDLKAIDPKVEAQRAAARAKEMRMTSENEASPEEEEEEAEDETSPSVINPFEE